MTFAEKNAISSAIGSNLTNLFNNAFNSNKNIDEPGYISILTQDFIPILKNILNSNINSMKFEVSGLFVHKSPIIEYIDKQPYNNQRCEIGDLLIIYSRKGAYNKTLFNNSLLLQAKRNVNKIKNDDCQLWLYTHWPRFKYRNKKIM